MVSADAARTLSVLAEQRKAITAARRDGDHTRALELLIQQRDLLLPEAAKSKADEALIAPILGQIERHMRAVRDEMHGGGGGRAGGGRRRGGAVGGDGWRGDRFDDVQGRRGREDDSGRERGRSEERGESGRRGGGSSVGETDETRLGSAARGVDPDGARTTLKFWTT